MKKILCIILSGLIALTTSDISAQQKNSLEKFYQQLEDAYYSFSCSYTLKPSGDASSFGKVTGQAQVEMQDEAYIFKGNGLAIVSDGQALCLIDESSKEAVLESVPETISEADYLQNPAYLIRGLSDNFKVEKASSAKDDKGTRISDNYVLIPTVNCGISRCKLTLPVQNAGLSSAVFELSDGTVLEVSIYDNKFQPKKSDSYFAIRQPSSFDKAWVVTDLR
jgi:hypothetical protein